MIRLFSKSKGLGSSRWLLFWLLIPTIVFELLIHIIPMLVGVYISFTHLTATTLRNWIQAPFVGFDNYLTGLNPTTPLGSGFFTSLGISLAYTILTVLVALIIGFGAALVVQKPFPGRSIFRTIFILPYTIPVIVVGVVWKFMFIREWGLVNGFLVDIFHLLGTKPFWLIGDKAFVAISIATVWKNFPFIFLIALAGLQTIPDSYYDAAKIDGANGWKQFWYITLPGIRPFLSVGVLLIFLWTFNDFNLPFAMMGSHPPTSADVLPLHIYVNSFKQWNFGTGAAMSVIMIVVLGLIALLFDRIFRFGRNE